jgi:hypothetical protein
VRRSFLWLTTAFALTAVVGCAHSSILFTAQGARFPVSMTEGIYDDQYKLRLAEHQVLLKRFTLTYRHFTLTSFAKPKQVDLSDTLAKLVKAYGGDAVVNLRVTGQGSGLDANCLSCIGLCTTVPSAGIIAPTEVQATVEGDIVRLKESGSSMLMPASDSLPLFFANGDVRRVPRGERP